MKMDTTAHLSEPTFVYIGTYTRREAFVEGKAEGIYVYRLNPASGALAYVSKAVGTINPSFLAIAPHKPYLYAVNEIAGGGDATGTVSAFVIDPATQSLTYLNQQTSHGLAPCYVSVDGTGQYVLVANYVSGNVCVLPIQDGGRLGEPTDVVQHQGSGPDPRQEGPHTHSIVPGPDGRFVYALDLGIDKIMVYRLDLQRGKLVPADPPWVPVAPGSGPRHLAFHPQDRFAYAINELNSTVTVYAYASARGTLQELQTISTLPDNFVGQNTGADIHVAPSGRFVYGSNRGHNSIVIFTVEPETGALSCVGHEPTQGATPRGFAIDPSGSFLLVANQDTDTVVSFHIDQATGKLMATGHVTEVPTPVCLRMLQPSG
jgi:6-phosphogluconolactonase